MTSILGRGAHLGLIVLLWVAPVSADDQTPITSPASDQKPPQTETSRRERKPSAKENPSSKDEQTLSQQTLWQFTLSNRTQLTGRIVSENPRTGEVDILLITGERRTLFRSDIVVQEEPKQRPIRVVDGKVWEDNPNRTRHLWSPSAMPLKKGEGYLSQKQLFFTSYAVGVTDNVAVLVGSLLPALFAGVGGFNLIGAVKVADQIGDELYVGLGAETIGIVSVGLAGLPFLSVTYGQPDAQISLNVGKPFALDENDAELGDALVSLSGMWRFKGNFALVSENIFLPSVSTSKGWGMLSFHGIAFRSIRENTAWDLGFVSVGGTSDFIPIPWFDWTWHFSP